MRKGVIDVSVYNQTGDIGEAMTKELMLGQISVLAGKISLTHVERRARDANEGKNQILGASF